MCRNGLSNRLRNVPLYKQAFGAVVPYSILFSQQRPADRKPDPKPAGIHYASTPTNYGSPANDQENQIDFLLTGT